MSKKTKHMTIISNKINKKFVKSKDQTHRKEKTESRGLF